MVRRLFVLWETVKLSSKVSVSSLVFRSLVMICLSVDFFRFILLGIHLASWICKVVSYKIWDVFSLYFLKYFFSPALFSSSPGTLMTQIWGPLLQAHRFTNTNYSLKKKKTLLSVDSDWVILSYLWVQWFAPSPLHSAIEPIHKFFISTFVSLKICHSVFLYVLFSFAKTCCVFAEAFCFHLFSISS